MYKFLFVMVLTSAAFGAVDSGWDEIKEIKKYQTQEISDPKFAHYLCSPEEIDEMILNATERYYVKATATDIAIYNANSSYDAAVIAYCDAFNLGKAIPGLFEVKGPIKNSQ